VTYRIEAVPHFRRRARKFLLKHPELRSRFIDVLDALSNDPFQPALGLHPLSGELQGQHAVRLTYSYRITLTLVVSERSITLLDVGSHDEVYR
jgi:mRNA-degrading endonuclease YafQ of YafQ-DinJ toxin-antitoxin module